MEAYGLIRGREDGRDYLYGNLVRQSILPPKISYRSQVGRIIDQGSKSSCVPASFVLIKEWQENKQRNFPKEWITLSIDFVYDQVQYWEPPYFGGSEPRDVCRILVNQGVCLEHQYSYKRITDKEKAELKADRNAKLVARRFKADMYVKMTTIEQAMQSVVTNGLISCGGDWIWDGTSRRKIGDTPVFDTGQGRIRGAHEYTITGYDLDREVFECVNSYGSSYADNGFFYLTFRAFQKHVWDSWCIMDKAHPLLKI